MKHDGLGVPARWKLVRVRVPQPLGLRPGFHQVERRVEGHLFISVLAYHFVYMLRLRPKAKGVDDSWEAMRAAMSTQHRVTAAPCMCARPRGPRLITTRSTRSWGCRPTLAVPIAWLCRGRPAVSPTPRGTTQK